MTPHPFYGYPIDPATSFNFSMYFDITGYSNTDFVLVKKCYPPNPLACHPMTTFEQVNLLNTLFVALYTLLSHLTCKLAS
jgi:hypothetical protein